MGCFREFVGSSVCRLVRVLVGQPILLTLLHIDYNGTSAAKFAGSVSGGS